MKIKKGQKIEVRSRYKGVYKAIALKAFDTEKDEIYPIATLETVKGFTQVWEKGDPIPCSRGLSRIYLKEPRPSSATN